MRIETRPSGDGRGVPHGQQAAAMRIAVVGIGQELLGDDAAGLIVCHRLQELAGTHPTSLIIAAGPAPENCTSQLRRFGPHWVVLVDAARMGAIPGTVRWIPWEAAEAIGGSTHTLPLRLLSEYLSSSIGCRVSLLGIQPANTALGTALSSDVREAVESTAQRLAALLTAAWRPGSPLVKVAPELLETASGHLEAAS